MKLITFSHQNQIRIGAVVDNEVVDSLGNANLPTNMLAFLAEGKSALNTMMAHIKHSKQRLALTDVQLLAPVPKPGKYLAIGLNYPEHINETQAERPKYPLFFNKQTSCVIGHNQPIHIPKVSDKVDYEGELAIVIGKRCRHVPIEKAREVIAGFTIANDVSVRDWQVRTPTWTLGKSFDTHGPLGAWLVTADEIDNPQQLSLKTWVDEQLRQHANTAQMLLSCNEMIAYLSTVMTLEPGDIISTGTPSGVGVKMNPRGYLTAGQTVKIEIEGIGVLSNPVILEPDNTALF